MNRAIIAVDGASKGNPGPAGIGVVISDESGRVLREIGEYIGETTNNVAEYTALIRALAEALEMGFSQASVQTDSELMAKQLSGQYKVRNDGIIPLYIKVKDLLSRFNTATVTHVLREKNKQADSLASRSAMSVKQTAQPALITEEVEAPAAPPKPKKAAPEAVKSFPVHTSSHNQFVDITPNVADAVRESGVKSGLCTVFVPHTTAAVTINENADPDVVRDIISTLERLVPHSGAYRHSEGNSDAHIKASMMGFSVTILVESGRLVLGMWQGIYFCEFDGPRNRKVYVKVI